MEDYLSRARKVELIRSIAAQITELAGHLNAASHRWLTLIAQFDNLKGWSDGSTHSCAHWLNWQCGLDLGAAREKVRVAHALEQLPKISAAMGRGEVSYSKVRAMTRVASPATEEYFLNIALHGTAHHVERLVRSFRRAQEAEMLSREGQQQANRYLRYLHDDDGSLVIKARLPAEAGALFMKAIDAVAGTHTYKNVSAETSEETPSFSARRADALGTIVESFLAHGEAPLNGGERQQVVVHVDAQTLKNSVAGRCELEDGPALSAETVRRLACDASIVAVIEDEQGEPLNVGRKTRSIPPALRRALNARDQGCRFPGCTSKRYVDAHHIQHWANGGETKASNLVTLCRFHHRQVHEGNVAIQKVDDGAVRFVRPDGASFDTIASDTTPPPTDWKKLVARHHDLGIDVNENTAATRWRGERMDHGLALEVLLRQEQKTGNASAETAG